MKKIFHTIILFSFFSMTVTSFAKNLDLKDITDGKYSSEKISGVNPLQDGTSYTQISTDKKQIVKYSFRTGEKVETLFDANTARNAKIDRIDGYIMSPDETNILIQTKTKSIYRRSFTAEYYIFNIRNNTLTPLSQGGPQQSPVFSPDGHQIAFVRNNNIFLVKLLFDNSESQITKDGLYNHVINGIPDWVYEEEFATSRSLEFTADSQMLVWIRYDESAVPTFSFPLYKGLSPERKEYDTYPGSYTYKYPVSGQTNSTVTVLSYDIKSHVTRQIKVPLEQDGYIPRIKATTDPNKIAVVTINRHQNQLDIYMANPRSTLCKLILRETNDKYVTESTYEDLHFYDGNFLFVSDRSGYKHLYWYNFNGQLVRQLTSGNYDVCDFYGFDPKSSTFYYASHEEGPTTKAIYSVDLKGKKKKLSKQVGDNNAIFSTSMAYYIQTYSNIHTPPVITCCDNNGKTLKVLIDNAKLKNELSNSTMGQKELFSFKTSEGIELNGWMIKPANFDSSKKYPVVMYQYSGPGSQQVKDAWGIGFYEGGVFESLMAQEGFIFVCVDGRGTGARGADFEKCTYLNLGDLESKDQVEAALYLGTLPYVDKNNIGIWGWSYGGFNTLMSMSEGRPVFKAGVAVAAPTSWKFYDTIYTERYMRTPNENPTGYALCPISRANQLHGQLLMIHGTADDNVHYRNFAEYTEALVQANKQFDMAVYTNRNHSIYGGNTRFHLATRLVNFFKSQLQ